MAIVLDPTNGITNVNGTAAAPAITGLDTDTGLYFGTNTLGLSTSGTAAITVDTSQNTTFVGNIIGKQSGLALPYQYYTLNSGYAGSNATGAQSVFGVGVTLAGSTIYEFEMFYVLAKTAGTTAHTIAPGFGGTATFNNFTWWGVGQDIAGGTYPITMGAGFTTPYNASSFFTNTQTAAVATNGITNANNLFYVMSKGIISVNAGGTLIPQYTLSAAPGGAYTTQIGAYIKISPLAASGSNVSIGSWA